LEPGKMMTPNFIILFNHKGHEGTRRIKVELRL
jgi:hypothetical protein